MIVNVMELVDEINKKEITLGNRVTNDRVQTLLGEIGCTAVG